MTISQYRIVNFHLLPIFRLIKDTIQSVPILKSISEVISHTAASCGSIAIV